MAIVFMDGFEHWTAAQALRKWDNVSASAPIIETDNPRTGSQCLGFNTSTAHLRKNLVPSLTTIIVGFAIRKDTLRAVGYHSICRVRASGSSQLGLQYSQSAQRFQFNNGTGSDQSSSSTNTYDLSSGYFHIEWKATFDQSPDNTNTVELRVNGNVEIGPETMDTDPQNADIIDSVEIANDSSLDEYRWDDFYVLNSTSPNNDFLGDVKIVTVYPDSDGNVSDWTGSGSPDWQQVDETTADDNTTNIISSTNGQQSLFGMGAVSGLAATVKGLQVNVAARKDGAGDGDIKILTRSGAGPSTSASSTYTVGAAASDHVYYLQQQDVDPNTSSAWVVSDINTAEFGVEQVS